MSPGVEKARVVLDTQSEGENGREFTREATGTHCKEGGGCGVETERDYGGMWL